MQNATRPNCIESSIVLSVKAVESCAEIHVMATFPSIVDARLRLIRLQYESTEIQAKQH